MFDEFRARLGQIHLVLRPKPKAEIEAPPFQPAFTYLVPKLDQEKSARLAGDEIHVRLEATIASHDPLPGGRLSIGTSGARSIRRAKKGTGDDGS